MKPPSLFATVTEPLIQVLDTGAHLDSFKRSKHRGSGFKPKPKPYITLAPWVLISRSQDYRNYSLKPRVQAHLEFGVQVKSGRREDALYHDFQIRAVQGGPHRLPADAPVVAARDGKARAKQELGDLVYKGNKSIRGTGARWE